MDQQPLHVIAVYSNPMRYRSRRDLFEKFVAYAGANPRVRLTIVEAAFGDRAFEFSEEVSGFKSLVSSRGEAAAPQPETRNLRQETSNWIGVRTESEIWHKENLVNIGLSRLPQDWQYVAWIDGDVSFSRPDWAEETIEQLQHFHIVQMFSQAQDLGPNNEPIRLFTGFGYSYFHRFQMPEFMRDGELTYVGPRDKWHSGFAWAASREALDKLGGLIDWGVLGSGDRHMACALIGVVDVSILAEASANYRATLMEWQDRAYKTIRRSMGYVPGLLLHYWHGRKVDRGYVGRWKILKKYNFDPRFDLKKDTQGMYRLVDNYDDRSIEMRDAIMRYFRSRQEDGISL